MPFSKKKKTIAIAVILGLLTLVATYFYQDRQNKQLIELKKTYQTNLEQAEMFRNIQLDSAQVYARSAYDLVKDESSLEFEKNTALLTLSDIEFWRTGASDELYERVEKCEEWFRERKMYDETFKANLLRLQINSFNGYNQVREHADDLINVAKLSKSDNNLAKAYYFKMEVRDYTRKWEDDVSILDSARMFAYRAKDSVLVSKIRMMSVLSVNGKKQCFDSLRLSKSESIHLNNPELNCLSDIYLAQAYATRREQDSALHHVDMGLAESKKYGSLVLETECMRQRSIAFIYNQQFDSLIESSSTSLELARKTNRKDTERHLLDFIYSGWMSKGEYSKAIEPLMEALEIAEETNSEQAVFIIQRKLLPLLTVTERFEEADLIYDNLISTVLNKERNKANDMDCGIIYQSKGHLEKAKKNLDSALYYYEKATERTKLHSASGTVIFNMEVSKLITLLDLNQNEHALKRYEFIMDKFPQFTSSDFHFLYAKSRLFFNLNRFNEANSAIKAALEKGKGKSRKLHPELYSMLSEIHESNGDLVNALAYRKKEQEINEELDENKDDLNLEKLQSKYELAQKESEIQKLDIKRLEQKNDIEVKESSLQRRRLFIILLSVLIVLIGVIAVFIYRRSKEARLREELRREAIEKEREVERLKTQESERAIELKNQLFTNISHEFRTPLTLINAPVEELMDKVDQENKEPLEVIKRNSDHLLEMVDEILELSRLDAGEAILTKKSFSLNAFFEQLKLNFKPVLKQKEIDLSTHLPEESYTVTGDEYRLKMVLNNLLKNAFNHTPKSGEIAVKVEASKTENQLKIGVFNSGDWIDDQFLPSIFDRYARSKDKEYSGYGIGLSFCKKIVELHGGEITAKNVEGGVLLSFSFPTTFEIGEPIMVESLESPPELNDEENTDQEHTLLIVEDNLDVQNVLKEMLSTNYKILCADDGEEGIVIAKEHQPDLIISDIMMPNVDGTQLTKTLKEEFATSHIPIILLTAKSTGHDKIAGLETGADDYLTKPFSPKELRIRVKNLIEQREKLKKRFSKNVFLMPEEITSTSLDQEFLKNATQIVEENMDNSEFNVEKFCRALALNRNSVHLKLKSLTGKSASQFINSIKLKKAAILLSDERISIIEVSELSGFNNRQAFYKAFKKQFEMTPAEYRKMCIG